MIIRNTLLTPILGLVLTGVGPVSQPAADPPDVHDLLKAQLEAAKRTFEVKWRRAQGGGGPERRVDVDQLSRWSSRWLEAQRELSPRKADQLAALEAHRTRMHALEILINERTKAGLGNPEDRTAAEFYRLEAELWLARAKAK